MNKRIRRALLPLAISTLFAVTPVVAQTDTSSAITGVVVNAAGEPVAGAKVEIVHEPSGTTKIVTTNADGRYNAQGMRVGGPYEITVSKADMERERDDVYLRLGQTSAINLILRADDAQKLGAITVTANALSRIFSPENKGLGTTISERQLERMPTPGRSIQNVVRMDPRVVIAGRNQGKISALGQNYRYNNITVDSVSANDPFGLNANGLPTKGTAISQDTIAAYNISTANYDVATRRGLGANIDAVTKSGTNEYHGSVYYVYQDSDSMVGKNQADRPFTSWDREWTGGFTLGGPIIEDKLFFFASYERSERDGVGGTWGAEGSGASQTVDGLTVEDVQEVRDIAASYGLADLGTAGGGDLVGLKDDRYLVKLDWNISDNHRAALVWRRTKEHEPRPSGGSDSVVLPSGWTVLDTDNESYALHLYDDWSLNFSSTATLSWSHFHREGGPFTGVEMPGITVHKGYFRGPTVEFGTNYSYQANRIDTKTLFAAWAGTWFAGDHAIKFGFDYKRDEKYNLFLQNYFGSYTFDSFEDFRNANISQYYYARPADGLGLDDVAANFTVGQVGVFVQDTWQIDNLSLQYGLRYDRIQTDDEPLYNQAFADAGFTTSTGTVLTTNQYTLDGESTLQPRAAFNYQFDTDRMMQLRGGVGLFMSNPPAVWIGNIYSNAGVNSVGWVCQSFRGCNPPPFSADPYNQNDVESTPGKMTVNTLDPNFHLPTSWKYTLGFDAELPGGLIGTIDLQHIDVEHAIWYQNVNLGEPTGILPDGRPTYYNIPTAAPRADGNYARANANSAFTEEIINLASTGKGKADNVTLQLKKPFRDNWSAMVGVTWGHTTEVNPGLSSVAYSSWKQSMITAANENVASTSNYETNWRTIASFAWRHAFFGNYYTSFSAFYDGHSGHPYSWVYYNDSNGDGYYNDLAYIPERGEVQFREGTDPQLIQEFWNYIESNEYLRSHQGEIAERNADRAPWFNQLDLSVSQEIPGLFDGAKGEIRLDFYNFLNLLDEDWGVEYRANFPGKRALANFYGVDPETGEYIYDISNYPFNNDGHYSARDIEVDTYPNDRAQRWGVQLTLRYEF